MTDTIKVGDPIPSMKLTTATKDGPREVAAEDIFGAGKVVLFAVPGAFTPTCSAKHMPSFLTGLDALHAKGVAKVACMAVNDAFVMDAWAKDQGVDDRIIMIADGSGAFTRALGMEFDLVARGLGMRSQRFALVAENGRVTHVAVEAPGAFDVSSAEAVLAAL